MKRLNISIRWDRPWLVPLLAVVLAGLALYPAQAQEPEPAAAGIERDDVAALYMARCAGCHTMGGGYRSGPDLLPSTGWQRPDLWAAVKRMERNAGPMTEQQVNDLTDFMKALDVRDRIAAEESRRRMQAAASLEPASAAVGRQLYFGQRAFKSGAPNCAGCHAVDGLGGTLAVDLTTVHQRFGEMGLTSAIENPTFPTMMPIYAAQPINAQEAAHLTAFLATTGGGSTISTPPVGLIAGGAALIMLGLLAVVGIRKRPGTRARLIRQANRR